MKPLVVELFCGMFGWSAGFVAEGYRSIGFDIEHAGHHGPVPEGCKLVLQDVLTLHGSQFRDAAVIVASPPCQNYSYLAMPWSRSKDPNNSKAAKALRRKWETEGPDNRLFDACFRIQREAIEARSQEIGCHFWHEGKSHCPECYIPMIVENVRGAQPWVGRSAWNYGSFHLWGDVPALMPINLKRGQKVPGFRFDGSGGSFQQAPVDHTENNGGLKRPGIKLSDGFNNWPKDENRAYIMPDGTKIGGDWLSDPKSTCRRHGSRSNARKAASAMIAKIPFELARHIAQVYKPR